MTALTLGLDIYVSGGIKVGYQIDRINGVDVTAATKPEVLGMMSVEHNAMLELCLSWSARRLSSTSSNLAPRETGPSASHQDGAALGRPRSRTTARSTPPVALPNAAPPMFHARSAPGSGRISGNGIAAAITELAASMPVKKQSYVLFSFFLGGRFPRARESVVLQPPPRP